MPRYDLGLPGPGEVCLGVLRVAGADGIDVWTGVCAAANVPATAASYSQEQLDRLADVLGARPGVLGIVGRSLAVRLSTYRALSALERGRSTP